MTLKVAIRHTVGAFALDVAFDAPGGVTALFGRSGAGKTSVIRAVAGLMRPDEGTIEASGRVLFDSAAGVNVPPNRRRIGVVFQDARLFPHLSVAGNLAFARWVGRAPQRGAEARVVELLGLGGLMRRRPAALSGGERQRVAMARTLLSAPDLLLLDEPLASLDEARKGEIMPYLERLRDDVGIPMIYVSHSVSEVVRLADRVVVLSEGRSVAVGPAARVFAQRGALGARDAGAVLEGVITGHEPADGLTALLLDGELGLTLPAVAAPVGARVRLRVPAADVMIARERPQGLSTRNILPARVDAIASGDGPGALVTLALGEAGAAVLVARVTQQAARTLELSEGARCYAVLKAFAAPAEDVTVVGPAEPNYSARLSGNGS